MIFNYRETIILIVIWLNSVILFSLIGVGRIFASMPPVEHKNHKIYELKVKTTFLDNSNLTLVALDSLDHEDKSINGKYTIDIKGTEYNQIFLLGRSQFPLSQKKSTFISLKPITESGAKPNFYFLFRSGFGIYPQIIPFYWIIGVPLGMVLLGYMFRRLILIIVILVILFFLFNKGLDPLHFAKGIYDWVLFHFHT